MGEPIAPGVLRRVVAGRVRTLERLCRKLGDPTAPPERAPARGPPCFASKGVRRVLGDRLGQQELFERA